jgi:hypothetical protein
MMYPCDKCLENNWSFVKNDDMIEATCNICGHLVEFSAFKKIAPDNLRSRVISKTGDLCRKCGTKVILRETRKKAKQLKKNYYFTAYYYCPKCHTMYLSERFKVYNSCNPKQWK